MEQQVIVKRYEQIFIIVYFAQFCMYMCIVSSQHLETMYFLKNVVFICIRHHCVQFLLNYEYSIILNSR